MSTLKMCESSTTATKPGRAGCEEKNTRKKNLRGRVSQAGVLCGEARATAAGQGAVTVSFPRPTAGRAPLPGDRTAVPVPGGKHSEKDNINRRCSRWAIHVRHEISAYMYRKI